MTCYGCEENKKGCNLIKMECCIISPKDAWFPPKNNPTITIEYDGKYPNLCSGTLIVYINDTAPLATVFTNDAAFQIPNKISQ